MPEITPAIRERFLSIFRDHGIKPMHIGCVVPSHVDEPGSVTCVLCRQEHLTEKYRLDFALPLPQRDGDTRAVTFYPASPHCIAEALTTLAVLGNGRNTSVWLQDLELVLLTLADVMRGAAPNDRVAQRKARIDGAFLTLPNLSMLEYFDGQVREHWAHFGERRIARAIELVNVLADFWKDRAEQSTTFVWPRSQHRSAMRIQSPFELRTLRARDPEEHTVCEICGEALAKHWSQLNGDDFTPSPFTTIEHNCDFCACYCRADVDFEITSVQLTRHPTDPHARVRSVHESIDNLSIGEAVEVDGQDRLARTLRAFNTIIGGDDLAAIQERLERGEAISDEFMAFIDDVRQANINDETRVLLIRSIIREPGSQTVRDIVEYGLSHQDITARQTGVLIRRLEARAMRADAPRCPVHTTAMMEVEGQYGPFFSCQDFPNCRITCNQQGQFRGVPNGTNVPETNGLPQRRHLGDQGARRRVRNDDPRQDLSAFQRGTIERTPLPPGLNARDMNTLGSIARTGTQRQETAPPPSSEESEAARKQGREFRKILIATIKQKCGID